MAAQLIQGEAEIQRGLGLPRLTTAQRTGYSPTEDGYIVYDTTLGKIFVYENSAWVDVQADINLFSTNLMSTASRVHTDNFGLQITGSGEKDINTTVGATVNKVRSNSNNVGISSTDGSTSTQVTAAPDELILSSSNGRYAMPTSPEVNSDLATAQLLARDTVTNRFKIINNLTYAVLSGASDPVDGTTTAYKPNQLYVNTTTNNLFRASTPSTDPDTSATGSVWVQIS